jgi:hypothetical protein
MSKHYGVKCHSCGNPIVLRDVDSSLSIIELATFRVPFDPIECPYIDCRAMEVYLPSEGRYFELADFGDRGSIGFGARLREFYVN